MPNDYISREALLADIEATVRISDKESGEKMREIRKIISRITAAPAADVRPVVRGEWEGKGPIILTCDCQVCSRCGEMRAVDNFCSSCGADMRPELTEEKVK